MVSTRKPCETGTTVDWGDGTPPSTMTSCDESSSSHTYESAGTYDVEVRVGASPRKTTGPSRGRVAG
jgi:PKD repeat protein